MAVQDETQARLSRLEARVSVLEQELNKSGPSRDSDAGPTPLPRRMTCDAPGLIVSGAGGIEPPDQGGFWRWVGNDGPLQFLLPVTLAQTVLASLHFAGAPGTDFDSLRVVVNDRPTPHVLEPGPFGRSALTFSIPPAPSPVRVVLAGVVYSGESAIKGSRPRAMKFYGLELNSDAPRDVVTPEPADVPDVAKAPPVRTGGGPQKTHAEVRLISPRLRERQFKPGKPAALAPDVRRALGAMEELAKSVSSQPRPTESVKPAADKAAPGKVERGAFDAMSFGATRLDERQPEIDGYRHLDISVFDNKWGDEAWEGIKFRIANDSGRVYLEFRSQPNWPEMFNTWPGDNEDEAGRFFRLPDPSGKPSPDFADGKDHAMVGALFQTLQPIVRKAATGIIASTAEVEAWVRDAAELSNKWLRG